MSRRGWPELVVFVGRAEDSNRADAAKREESDLDSPLGALGFFSLLDSLPLSPVDASCSSCSVKKCAMIDRQADTDAGDNSKSVSSSVAMCRPLRPLDTHSTRYCTKSLSLSSSPDASLDGTRGAPGNGGRLESDGERAHIRCDDSSELSDGVSLRLLFSASRAAGMDSMVGIF